MTLDVRQLVRDHRRELGVLPFAPPAGEEDDGIEHADGQRHGHSLGLSELWDPPETKRPSLRFESEQHARIADRVRLTREPAAQSQAHRQTSQQTRGDEYVCGERDERPWDRMMLRASVRQSGSHSIAIETGGE